MKKFVLILVLIGVIVVLIINLSNDNAVLPNWLPGTNQAEPPTAGPYPPYPEIPASTIIVPLQLNLSSVETAVNGQGVIPTTLHNQGWTPQSVAVGLADITYSVTRGHIGLNMEGNVLVTTVPITIQAGARWGLFEGAKIPVWCNDIHLTVQFETTVTLTDDWVLDSHSTPVPYNKAVTCVVDVGLIDIPIDISNQARAGINEGQRAAAEMIDNNIPSLVDAKAFAETAWQALSDPIALGETGWLALNPEQLQVGSISGNGQALTIPIGVVARPQLLIGRQPAVKDTPLPPVQAPDADAGGFRVTLEVDLPYDTATAQMAGLIGTEHTFNGQTVTIDDIRIYGAGSLAVIELNLSGDFNGTVYLTGEPQFDPARKVLFLDGIDFDIHSRNLLVNTAEWLFYEELLAQIENLAVWDVSTLLNQASEAANNGLNQELNGLRLTGQVDNIELIAILPTESAFKVIATAVGALSASVSYPGH